jgi:hypothetical protein
MTGEKGQRLQVGKIGEMEGGRESEVWDGLMKLVVDVKGELLPPSRGIDAPAQLCFPSLYVDWSAPTILLH